MSEIKIAQFRAGESNYNYLIYSSVSKIGVAIDPFQAQLVNQQAQSMRIKICAILNTHGHWDHVAGNQELSHLTGAPIAAYAGENIPGITRKLVDGENFELEDISIKILFTPGHTLGHICLLVEDCFFLTGDTLFLGGCGNCKFGGDAEKLFESLKKISQLPDHLKVYCGHEYALKNLDFCMKHDPQNSAVKEMREKVSQALARGDAYVSTLGEEKAHNIFLRVAGGITYPQFGNDAKSVFLKLRQLKDEF